MATALLVALLTGCAGDDRSPEDGPSSPPTAQVEAIRPAAPTRAYAATLGFVEDSDALGAGESAGLILTNTGLGDDDYFVLVTPPSAGAVSPTQVSLSSGESVQLALSPRVGADLSVAVLSATLESEIARLVVTGNG